MQKCQVLFKGDSGSGLAFCVSYWGVAVALYDQPLGFPSAGRRLSDTVKIAQAVGVPYSDLLDPTEWRGIVNLIHHPP